ncbi:MAG: HesA/MoeB/ThiF family protein [Desulfomonile tiedjei]|nr:HesA/MoeB/ThiF family protein [Desulfomonile tiedjei]
MNLDFSEEEIMRYSRNMILPEVGHSGQERLKASSVLLIGMGGIGSPAALYLAAAGVGRIGLCDCDAVELSNLQRQVVFRTTDVDRAKVECAKEAISALNPNCVVDTYHMLLNNAKVARDIVRGYDVVIDGSDNFCTRFLVADCCWLEGVALVSASAVGFQGQLLVVIPGAENPCYRCLVPEPSPGSTAATCRVVGIFGGIVGVMGSLATVETVKVFLERDADSARRFLMYDGLRCRFVIGERVRDPDCPLCGDASPVTHAVEQDSLPFEQRHGIYLIRNREECEYRTWEPEGQ